VLQPSPYAALLERLHKDLLSRVASLQGLHQRGNVPARCHGLDQTVRLEAYGGQLPAESLDFPSRCCGASAAITPATTSLTTSGASICSPMFHRLESAQLA